MPQCPEPFTCLQAYEIWAEASAARTSVCSITVMVSIVILVMMNLFVI